MNSQVMLRLLYAYISVCLYIYRGACAIMVSIIGNELGDVSSYPK